MAAGFLPLGRESSNVDALSARSLNYWLIRKT